MLAIGFEVYSVRRVFVPSGIDLQCAEIAFCTVTERADCQL